MTLSEFLIPSKSYASLRGPEDTIVLSSRARLARNLCHASFPSYAKKTERLRVFKQIRDAVLKLKGMDSCFVEGMGNLSSDEKTALVERHLISREHAARGAGSGHSLPARESRRVPGSARLPEARSPGSASLP